MVPVTCPLIESLSEAERKRLLDRAVPRRLARGDALYFAGDTERRVHFVCSGFLKLSACDGEGRETTLALATEGDIVGETAAVDGGFQPVDVVAMTRSEVLGVDAELFLDVVTRDARAALELARVVAVRTRWIAATASERATTDVSARLAARLLDLAEMLGRMHGGTIEVDLPLTRTDVGHLAGMCRESASKAINRMTREGILDYSGRTLRIFRPDVLERIRCAGRAAEPCRSAGGEARRRSR
ncbi:MAG TPA: Crp/Fnr family transcriptional regulator [Actinomycetota bacterium]|nr:Crp/Fnr family transcriptional regulator [Actinomycetota bacterium]